MVGVEPRRLVLPGDVVLDEVPDAGLAAPHLETVPISRRRAERAVHGVPIAERPRVLDGDRNLLVDQIVAVIGVPPRSAAPDDRGGARRLVVDAEAVGVLSLTLRRGRI